MRPMPPAPTSDGHPGREPYVMNLVDKTLYENEGRPRVQVEEGESESEYRVPGTAQGCQIEKRGDHKYSRL